MSKLRIPCSSFDVTYGPTSVVSASPPTGLSPPPAGAKFHSFRYSMDSTSPELSPMAPAWKPARRLPLPIIRFSIMWPYSCPITDMSKSPSTHGA
jgi:hypothetical protein